MNHLTAEQYELTTRRRLLVRLREHLDQGYRDPELLYLGARYAASLNLPSEAERFLTPLTELLVSPQGEPSPAYAPVALLHLHILAPHAPQRSVIQARLERLWSAHPHLATMLKPQFDPASFTPDSLYAHLDALAQGTGDARAAFATLFDFETADYAPAADAAEIAPETAAEDVEMPPAGREVPPARTLLQRIQQLAAEAAAAYKHQDATAARFALEQMLLLDGNQPEVLRNLLTITSEQQDIEAYERYWRRYVALLFWRIVHGHMRSAWDDLVMFYSRIADVMYNDISSSKAREVHDILDRPGFLSRWVETHFALIWLDAIGKSHWELQTGLPVQALRAGQQGYRALMRHWFELFYPEFLPYVHADANHRVPALLAPSAEFRVQLHFDPNLRVLRFFLSWAQMQFALHSDGENGVVQDAHADAVLALATCTAYISPSYYNLERFRAQDDDDPNKLYEADISAIDELLQQQTPALPLAAALQNACALPFNALRLNRYLGGEGADWAGIVETFGAPELGRMLAPSVRLYLGMGLCNVDRPLDGVRVMCHLLPEFPADELSIPPEDQHEFDPEERKKYYLFLNWHGMLAGAAQSVAQVTDPLPESLLCQQFEEILERSGLLHDPDLAGVFDTMRALVIRQNFNEVGTQVSAALRSPRYALVRQPIRDWLDYVRALPKLDPPSQWHAAIQWEIAHIAGDHLQVLRERSAEIFDNAYIHAALQDKLGEIQELFKIGDADRARPLVEALPDHPDAVRDIKQHYLNQLLAAQAIKSFREALEANDLSGAHFTAMTLPDELSELRDQLLAQVKQHQEIHSILEDIKGLVQQGMFDLARETAYSLPDELSDLRANILEQIDQAESQSAYLSAGPMLVAAEPDMNEVEALIDEVRELVQHGDYDEARWRLDQLPYSLRDLHDQLMDQIDQAENVGAANAVVSEVQALVQRGDLAGARRRVNELSYADPLRSDLLRQLDQLDEQDSLNAEAERVVADVRRLLERRDYSGAQRRIYDLPDKLSKLRNDLLSQVAQVESTETTNAVVSEVQALVQRGDLSGARRRVNELPYSNPARDSLLKQLDQLDEQDRLNRQANSAVAEVRLLMERNDYSGARRRINQLPRDLSDLRDNLVAQVDQQEEINDTLDQIRGDVQWGDFSSARDKANRLPEPLKSNVLAQIKQAQRGR